MKPALYRPNWDYASFLMRADVERDRAPRIESEPLHIKTRLDIRRAFQAWRTIGVHNDAASIREHIMRLKRWKRRLRK